MFTLLCLLTGIGCAAAPPPPPQEPPPAELVTTAEEATDREEKRIREMEDAARNDATATQEERQQKERTDRDALLTQHRRNLEARAGTTPGRWNPSKGEHASPSVSPPPARQCRTVSATEVQGRPYTVRQADGSYAVGVEPVPVGTLPLEICP